MVFRKFCDGSILLDIFKMRKKEYEQKLIQDLAREREDIIKKAENTEKYNIQILRGREYTLNKIIEGMMGFEFDSIRVSKKIYIYRYIKEGKVRHTRNSFKRR